MQILEEWGENAKTVKSKQNHNHNMLIWVSILKINLSQISHTYSHKGQPCV